jgi:hypothetical protein
MAEKTAALTNARTSVKEKDNDESSGKKMLTRDLTDLLLES